MGLGAAREHLQLDVPVCVNVDDPGDLRVGVLVAGHYLAAHRQLEAGPGISGPGPQVPVVVMSMKSTAIS